MNLIRNALLILVALVACIVLSARGQGWTPPSVNWNSWSWEAPNPALPDTEWYDYGEGSTSNGPMPAAEFRMAQAPKTAPIPKTIVRPAAPVRETSKVGIAYNEPKPGRVYLDSFVSLRTPDFTDANYGYGIGVGYQFSKYWSGEIRTLHHGLDADGSAIQDVGGRLVARMPFELLAPYTFIGASFDLERDAWHLQPGAGLEIGVHQSLKGLSLFAEGGLDANLHGQSGYLFSSGIRIRF